MEQQQQRRRINVEIGEAEAEGIYANMAMITHSPSEFIIDFARMMPGVDKSKVQARLIMTPQNAKAFQKALEENIAKFEGQFGPIPAYDRPEMRIGSPPATPESKSGSRRGDYL